MTIHDCVEGGAGACLNEALIEELQARIEYLEEQTRKACRLVTTENAEVLALSYLEDWNEMHRQVDESVVLRAENARLRAALNAILAVEISTVDADEMRDIARRALEHTP